MLTARLKNIDIDSAACTQSLRERERDRDVGTQNTNASVTNMYTHTYMRRAFQSNTFFDLYKYVCVLIIIVVCSHLVVVVHHSVNERAARALVSRFTSVSAPHPHITLDAISDINAS